MKLWAHFHVSKRLRGAELALPTPALRPMGYIHSFLVATSYLINKNKYLNQLRKDFLVRWLPRVNIWCTKFTAVGTLGT